MRLDIRYRTVFEYDGTVDRIVGDAVVFAMPGSLKACQLACKALIFPELSHILRHLVKG